MTAEHVKKIGTVEQGLERWAPRRVRVQTLFPGAQISGLAPAPFGERDARVQSGSDPPIGRRTGEERGTPPSAQDQQRRPGAAHEPGGDEVHGLRGLGQERGRNDR